MNKTLIINTLIVFLLAVTSDLVGHAQNDAQAIAERAYELLVAKDYDAAFPLMRKAAEMGDCVSKGNLGTMYYKGLGTAVNYDYALKWWNEAEQGGCNNEVTKKYLDELLTTKVIVVDNIHYIINDDNTLTVTFTDKNSSFNYKELDEAIIPERVTYNGNWYAVTSIGSNAFNYSDLTSVTIPNSVTSIEDEAFCDCDKLVTLSIPSSVKHIGEGAFSSCSALTSIVVAKDNSAYDSRENCNAIIETATNTLLAGCQNSFIPNSVTAIGYGAFDHSPIKTIFIPNSVKTIDKYAFYGSSLTSLSIPNSVTAIGDNAFTSCFGIESLVIPNSVTSIGYQAFSDINGLRKLTIGSGVTKMGNWAFSKCSYIREIKCLISDVSKVEMGTGVFYGCPTSACVLRVPKGTANAYANAEQWKDFTKIIEQ